MAATSHPAMTLAAIEVLRAGGSAVDAGVAAAFLSAVAEPAMAGLGGDAFALYQPPGATRPLSLSASGALPKQFDAPAACDASGAIPRQSAHAVTVPTMVAGLCRLHAEHGKLPLDAVLAPAIAAAETGLPVAPRAAFDWERNAAALLGPARRWYLKPSGAHFEPGDLFRHDGIAETLRAIAKDGPRSFYDGAIAEDIVATLSALGGAHRREDLANAPAGAVWTEPVAVRYRELTVWTPPPNGQGVCALMLLGLFERLGLERAAPGSVDRLLVETRAVQAAYAARDAFVGDAATAAAAGDPWRRLLDAAVLDTVAAAVEDPSCDPVAATAAALDAPSVAEAGARWRPSTGDTITLAVVDAEGGALSLITSIFAAFGSGLASERYGVLFHNRGVAFSRGSAGLNIAAPDRRPLHTLIPALATDVEGRPVFVAGVMGGQYQAAGVAGLIARRFGDGLDLQDAIDRPRAFPENGALSIEAGWPDLAREQIASSGWPMSDPTKPIGGAQAIEIDHARGVLIGGSDPRKDGVALGY